MGITRAAFVTLPIKEKSPVIKQPKKPIPSITTPMQQLIATILHAITHKDSLLSSINGSSLSDLGDIGPSLDIRTSS